MAGHLMLVWPARVDTCALEFHYRWGMPLRRALDLTVARHLVTIRPDSSSPASAS